MQHVVVVVFVLFLNFSPNACFHPGKKFKPNHPSVCNFFLMADNISRSLMNWPKQSYHFSRDHFIETKSQK